MNRDVVQKPDSTEASSVGFASIGGKLAAEPIHVTSLAFARLAVDQRANQFQFLIVDLGRFEQMLHDRRR